MRFVWASATHGGRTRKNNEDAFHPELDGRGNGPLLVAVADGMGGHSYGEVASRLAIEGAVGAEGTVRDRVLAANQTILSEVLGNPLKAGMGTTLTIAELWSDGEVTIGHVGDSRAYRLHLGRLHQITLDHTFVQAEVSAGRLTPEQARTHPARALLTRALGGDPVEVDVMSLKMEEGDRLLVCSDGLNSMITDDLIAEVLRSGVPSEAAWKLIEEANRAGGHDNISVVLVEAVPDESAD